MDGPNVNWRFFEMLQQEHAEHFGGAQLAVVGVVACILSIMLSMWIHRLAYGEVPRALHTIFHNVPARREDFCNLTKSKIFALPFCGHRWVENLPVAERALVIWPDMMKYVEAVSTKNFLTLDVLLWYHWGGNQRPSHSGKLHFFMAVCRSVTPFLTRYQTDEPVLPFIGNDLAELLKVRWIFSFYCHSDLLSSDKLGSFNNTEEKKHCKVRVLILYCKIFCILKYVYFYLFIVCWGDSSNKNFSMPHLSIWSLSESYLRLWLRKGPVHRIFAWLLKKQTHAPFPLYMNY